jgi:catechol 2,3-dioxygenase-like lactoylglutathione lyase family enzyme
MILGLAHPGLVVPDLATAESFYCEMFGFRRLSEMAWQDAPAVDRAIGVEGSAARSVMLAGHNCFLELFEYQAPAASISHPGELGAHEPGIRHLAFFVDDVRAEYERLLALGGQRLGEPIANSAGRLAVYARDPFGNLIELCEPPDEEERLERLPGIQPPNDDPSNQEPAS